MRMQTRFSVMVLAAGLLWAANAAAQTGLPEAPHVIVVASGEIEKAPDRVTVSFRASARADSAAQAKQQMDAVLQSAMTALSAERVNEEQITAADLSLYPRYDYGQRNSDEGPRLIGYEAARSLEVELSDFTRMNAVIDAVLGAGVAQVNQVRYHLAEPDAARAEAQAVAVDKAKAEAERLAAGFGAKLGSIYAISTQVRQNGAPQPMMMAKASMEDSAGGPDFSPDDLSFSAQVEAVFLLRTATGSGREAFRRD